MKLNIQNILKDRDSYIKWYTDDGNENKVDELVKNNSNAATKNAIFILLDVFQRLGKEDRKAALDQLAWEFADHGLNREFIAAAKKCGDF